MPLLSSWPRISKNPVMLSGIRLPLPGKSRCPYLISSGGTRSKRGDLETAVGTEGVAVETAGRVHEVARNRYGAGRVASSHPPAATECGRAKDPAVSCERRYTVAGGTVLAPHPK